jgi:hypothetical protein
MSPIDSARLALQTSTISWVLVVIPMAKWLTHSALTNRARGNDFLCGEHHGDYYFSMKTFGKIEKLKKNLKLFFQFFQKFS